MRRVTVLSFIAALALVLAACAPAAATATQAPTVSVPVTGDTETPAATLAPTTAPTSAATSAPTSAGTTTGTSMSVMTSSTGSVSEPFLVDQSGRAIYVYANDTQNSGTSACTGSCATQWPPVTSTLTAGTGVQSSMLGTITRDDGTTQATYNGWPLYYNAADTGAGSITGQGMEGLWFLVSASGNAIKP